METYKTVRLLLSLVLGVTIVLAAVGTARVEKISKTIRKRIWLFGLGFNSNRIKRYPATRSADR